MDRFMQKILKVLQFFILVNITIFLVGCNHPKTKLKHLNSSDIILAFGDSLTFDVGTTSDNSYPQVLAQLTGMKVINAGISGEETKDGLLRITTELDHYQPKLVIFCLGGNDM